MGGHMDGWIYGRNWGPMTATRIYGCIISRNIESFFILIRSLIDSCMNRVKICVDCQKGKTPCVKIINDYGTETSDEIAPECVKFTNNPIEKL